ncbi:MAG: beta-lactamase family protein [Alphaproteobacteria bacterium]|nr:beta-lactamase family protein [Alphaproteobacteria bacterium]
MSVTSSLDQITATAMAEGRIVGGAVMVSRGGEPLYHKSFGLADREAGKATSFDTIYRLASVTKPMVSLTALALCDAGKLSVEDAVADHLPYFTPRYKGTTPTIRIRHLLTHTAGLGYGYAGTGVAAGLRDETIDFETNFTRLAAQELHFEPGTAWEYSVAIDVLGAVIAKVTGGTLEDAVHRYITGPLGMTDTAFHVTDAARLASNYGNTAAGAERMGDSYVQRDDQGNELIYSPSRAFNMQAFQSGGAGMVGTPTDLFAFFEHVRLGAPNILKPDTFRMASSAQTGAVDRVPGCKFSFFSDYIVDPAVAATPESAGTLGWGGVYGHSWFIDPAKELTVLMMSNTAPAGVNGAYVEAVRDAVYAGL